MPVAIAGGPCAFFGRGQGGGGHFISQLNWLPGMKCIE